MHNIHSTILAIFFIFLQCLSLPVVVVVHGSQQPAAEATIFWDNSFADPVSNILYNAYHIAHSHRTESRLLCPTVWHGQHLQTHLIDTLPNKLVKV